MLSQDEVVTKQKQRSGFLLNVNKELTKALTAIDACDEKSIQVSLVKLRGYQQRLNDYNNVIQDALTGEAQDRDIQKAFDIDDNLQEVLAQLEATSAIMKKEALQQGGVGDSSAADPTQNHDVSLASHSETSRVRLPKIELRLYNGDPLKWDEFWDYYDVTFHSNPDIPVIEKFTYLRSILTDDALRLIEGYRLTAANYDEVIDALKERFGDPEVAIFQHFDAMLTLRAATGDVGDLQHVFDVCESHIRSLIALGLTEDTFGRVFAPILLSKLPGNVRVELIRKKGRGTWSLSKLREFLRDEIYARDMSKRSFGAQTNTKIADSQTHEQRRGNYQHFRNYSGRQGKQFTVSAMSNVESNNKGRKSLECLFCKGPHFNNKCTIYKTAASRRQQLNGRCYSCLRNGHSARACPTKKPCFFCKETSHHQSICETKFARAKVDGTSTQLKVSTEASGPRVEKSITSSVMSHNGQRGVLQTAVAEVSGTKGTSMARHMLDNGSDNSFISSKLAEEIGARCVGSESISLAGFADAKRRQKTYKVYEFDVCLRNNKKLTVKAYGTDVIICSVDKLAFDQKKYPILTRLPLAEPLVQQNQHVGVDVLIGSDYYYDIVQPERIPLKEGLVLLDSKLGYIIAGRTNAAKSTGSNMLLSRSTPEPTNFDLERFWKLEEIGVKEVSDTFEDEIALSNFNKTIHFDEDEKRYMVKWPFKTDCPLLPDNFGLALGRLKSLVARANTENKLVENYQTIFDDQVAKQIIEECPLIPDGQRVHYLPHHAVITPQKATTKVRIVYDASSKTKANVPSLNDCVHRGPVMLENLCGLLMRFRLNPIGVVSDIEKAFLQIGLQTEDRDVVRFLWLRDPSKPCSGQNLIHYRFRRVCFGVIASPFLLGGTLVHHLNKVGTPAATEILKNLYVDNVIESRETIESARSYYTEAKQIFNQVSMNLREWFSNDTEFMASIPQSDRGKGEKTKVLGLLWNLSTDTLTCSSEALKTSDTVTKRTVLHTIAKVYDPCGYFTPVTSPAKWLMQELWQLKYNWDTPLSSDLIEQWKDVFAELAVIHQCAIPRCYFTDPIEHFPVELHVFCDASAKAYAAAVYIVTSTNGNFKSSLVFSKCRISPLKRQSIPRLELLAATMGIRVLEFVAKELRLPIKSRTLWSDSQCVLHWIVGKPVSTVFVRNRVNEIRKVSDVEYRFVPTADNPADIPTRGLKLDELKSSNFWWEGPRWICDRTSWPNNPFVATNADVIDNGCNSTAGAIVMTADSTDGLGSTIDATRYSTLSRLLRVTAWVKRFITKLRNSVKQRSHRVLRSVNDCSSVNGCDASILMIHEIKAARLAWEKDVQRASFPNALKSLKSPRPLVMDSDGFICCQGRLGNADVLDSAKCPKLLPHRNQYTRLVIMDYHERLGHVGVNQTLAELRCEYWITKGRSEVKKVLRECLLCRRQKGGPFQIPPAPDLPEFRVMEQPPFSTVGIDYLGPLIVFGIEGVKHKVWICLFTCAVTRAVHLEVVNQMNTEQFLLCLRRFIAFFGCPNLIVSDNAGQFELSHRVLHKLWIEASQSKDVLEFSAANQIGWKFITESAPWMGGFYERLVGIVKSCLKALIDRRRLTITELQTVVYEASSIVNSRPLTYIEDTSGDLPLTPAHLLMRHRTITPFVSKGEPEDNPASSQGKLVAGWKRLRALLDSFWAMWKKQYLLSLREQQRSRGQRNAVRCAPQLNDVVLVEDKTLPRCQWRIGKVVDLVPSGDNKIRSCKISLPHGKILSRPIKQLYPLELKSCPTVDVHRT